MRILISFFTLLCSASVIYGQEDTVKFTKTEKKEFRKQQEIEYLEWERTYFNSPGDWYINAKFGYGVPYEQIENEEVPPFNFLGSTNYFESPDGTKSDKVIMHSTGAGPRLSISVGKMFNRFIGVEFQLGRINENELTLSSINKPGFKSLATADLWHFHLDPLLTIQSPNLKNFYIYGKIGPHLPFYGKPTAHVTIDDRSGALITGLLPDSLQPIIKAFFESNFGQKLLSDLDYHAVMTGDVKIFLQEDIHKDNYGNDPYSIKDLLKAIGINASFGFRYQASPIVSVFGEIGVMGFNISLAQTIITDLDGKATLLGGLIPLFNLQVENSDLTFGEALGEQITEPQIRGLLEVIYFNELDEHANNPNIGHYNPGEPRHELAPRLNVVSVGINVGVQINFPGKSIYYRENSRKAPKEIN